MNSQTLNQLTIIAEKGKRSKQDSIKQIELEIESPILPPLSFIDSEEKRVCSDCIENCIISII
jgi:hypothetical protein